MGVLYYLIDELHETVFDLHKCGWLPRIGTEIRDLGRETLIEQCQENATDRDLAVYWTAVGEWIWAFCENAEFRVRLVNDSESNGDEPWWSWPVVLDRMVPATLGPLHMTYSGKTELQDDLREGEASN